jgi:DeoR/GlpR family transcriptional regulator of sugar metabolism
VRLYEAILGISTIDLGYGMSTASHAGAQIKKMAIEAASVRIGLVDHS